MIGYIAKDKDENIYLHTEEPMYNYRFDEWYSQDYINITGEFPEFDNMSFDDEPIKVEVNIKRV